MSEKYNFDRKKPERGLSNDSLKFCNIDVQETLNKYKEQIRIEQIADFFSQMVARERTIEVKRRLLSRNPEFKPETVYRYLTGCNGKLSFSKVSSFLHLEKEEFDPVELKMMIFYYSDYSFGTDSGSLDKFNPQMGYTGFLRMIQGKKFTEQKFSNHNENYSQSKTISESVSFSLKNLIKSELRMMEDLAISFQAMEEAHLNAEEIIKAISMDTGSITKEILRSFFNWKHDLNFSKSELEFLVSKLANKNKFQDQILVTKKDFSKFLALFRVLLDPSNPSKFNNLKTLTMRENDVEITQKKYNKRFNLTPEKPENIDFIEDSKRSTKEYEFNQLINLEEINISEKGNRSPLKLLKEEENVVNKYHDKKLAQKISDGPMCEEFPYSSPNVDSLVYRGGNESVLPCSLGIQHQISKAEDIEESSLPLGQEHKASNKSRLDNIYRRKHSPLN